MTDMKRNEGLSIEEKTELALLSMSDAVRMFTEELAIMKRAFSLEFGTEEEFDKAFNREMDRAYKKVRHMSRKDITIHMLLKMMVNKPTDFDIEGGEEDA